MTTFNDARTAHLTCLSDLKNGDTFILNDSETGDMLYRIIDVINDERCKCYNFTLNNIEFFDTSRDVEEVNVNIRFTSMIN